MVGGKPYVDADFDLNISPVENGYIISVGSAKGEKLMAGSDDLTAAVSDKHKDEQKLVRGSVTEAVERQNAQYKVSVPYDKHNLGSDEEAWAHVTSSCVGCGACNRACPTCTCFLLWDSYNFV